MSEKKKEDKEDNLAFLQYLRETEKFPIEMEALRTTITSNKSTVNLADESIKHFSVSRKNNNIALIVSISVSFITLIILTVQTLSTTKTQLNEPLELNQKQLQEIIKSQETNNSLLIQRLDSLNSEVKTVSKNLNLQNNNSDRNEKSNNKSNK